MINPITRVQGNSLSEQSQTNGWGGVAGIFRQLTVQAGLDYDVALSTPNAATLRGDHHNTANSINWDLTAEHIHRGLTDHRSNISATPRALAMRRRTLRLDQKRRASPTLMPQPLRD